MTHPSDRHIVVESQITRPQGKAVEDLCVGLEAHVQQPVDRQQQEQQIERHDNRIALDLGQGKPLFFVQDQTSVAIPFIKVRHHGVEHIGDQQDHQIIHDRERRRRTKVKLSEGHLDQIDRQEGGRVTRPPARHDERFGVNHEAV
eukprot:CAMPEP_0184468032 /NCGR_PEP_ID=MMETSP0740-20130409/76218_1 /TAXON_ID=385413 /ORGANISM="Thalassiosira miniscula, Strain CCMP1093" /LENGTH=144 /DNA_ID=CAMNT_0026843529 /DNA_START=184 /DNA_END=615 /DNA_ORIENTATION=-